MSRKNKFIEKLTKEQKSSLKKGYQTGKSHIFRRKCHCILMSHEGKTVRELCEFFSVSQFVIECIDEVATKVKRPTVLVLDNAP